MCGGGAGVGARNHAAAQGGMDATQLRPEGQEGNLGIWAPLDIPASLVCSLGWEGSWGGGCPGSNLALLLAPNLPSWSEMSAFGKRLLS